MKNSSLILSVCVIAALITAGSAARCFYEYTPAVGLLDSCADGCRDYGTFDAAAEACDLLDACSGVSYTFVRGKPNALGPNSLLGWQLRSGTNLSVDPYNQNNYSFIKKTKVCNKNNVILGGPIFDYGIGSSCVQCTTTYNSIYQVAESLVKKTNSNGSITMGNNISFQSYSGQKLNQVDFGVTFFVSKLSNTEYTSDSYQLYEEARGKGFNSCFKDCVDYSSLKEAQQVCNSESQCTGITYAYISLGGSSSVGYIQGFGYQLRSGSLNSKSSHQRSISWSKVTKKDKNNLVPAAETKPVSTPATEPVTQAPAPATTNAPADVPTGLATPTTTADKGYQPAESAGDAPAPVPTGLANPTNTADEGYQPAQSAGDAPAPVPTITPSKIECPVFYTECDYQGEAFEICEIKDPDFSWRQYKSLRVPTDYYVQVFESDQFQGKKHTFKKDVSCGLDIPENASSNVSFALTSSKSHKKIKRNGY